MAGGPSDTFNNKDVRGADGVWLRRDRDSVVEPTQPAVSSYLESVAPGLTNTLAILTSTIEPFRTNDGKVNHAVAVSLPLGERSVGGASTQAEFLQRYHDIPGGTSGSGQSISALRAQVSSQEQFQQMQANGTLSQNAAWVEGGGMYITNNVKIFQTSNAQIAGQGNVPDPYAYRALEEVPARSGKARNGERFDQRKLDAALGQFSPKLYGLPLDMAEQVKAGAADMSGEVFQKGNPRQQGPYEQAKAGLAQGGGLMGRIGQVLRQAQQPQPGAHQPGRQQAPAPGVSVDLSCVLGGKPNRHRRPGDPACN